MHRAADTRHTHSHYHDTGPTSPVFSQSYASSEETTNTLFSPLLWPVWGSNPQPRDCGVHIFTRYTTVIHVRTHSHIRMWNVLIVLILNIRTVRVQYLECPYLFRRKTGRIRKSTYDTYFLCQVHTYIYLFDRYRHVCIVFGKFDRYLHLYILFDRYKKVCILFDNYKQICILLTYIYIYMLNKIHTCIYIL